MNQPQEYLQDIKEIRAIMDRSTRFIALSGMTGIVSGIAALITIVFVFWYFGMHPLQGQYTDKFVNAKGNIDADALKIMVAIFSGLFFFAMASTYYLTSRRAEAAGESLWRGSAKKLWLSLGLPLFMGGGFCLALLYHGYLDLLAPASLMFYGMTLYAGSKYTLDEVKVLGICQMILGIISAIMPNLGLLIWAMGFGMVHVVYGVFMYYKYEK